ncbi:MAG: glycosyltransferase [Chitinivibrionales bacterium]|nr:glycosyltransferase [Chitinivibrionales bacterium]
MSGLMECRAFRSLFPSIPLVKLSKKSVPVNHKRRTPMPIPLSLCMIVKNEASILSRCLKSAAPVADEIIVVDTGSEDDTTKVAEQFGARVIRSEWRNDFSYARNISIDHASGEWILWLDADDFIPPESIEPLEKLKQEKPDKVFGFIIRNQKPGGTGSEFTQARMFPNHPKIRFERKIHEQIMLSALRIGMKLVNKNIIIEHHGYADPSQVKIKAQRNIDALLDEYNPQDPDAVMAVEIADAYSILGEWQKAGVWFQKAVEVPDIERIMPVIVSHACLGLAKTCIEQKTYAEAIKYLQRSLKLCPGRADSLYSLAVAQELSGASEDALKSLWKITTSSSQPLQVSVDWREAKIKAFLRIERLLETMGRREEALENTIQALEQFPARPEIHTMHGRSLLRMGKLIEALHAFEQSLKCAFPGNIDAHLGLCCVYRKAGRQDAVTTTMKSIQNEFYDNPRYWAYFRDMYGTEGIPASFSKDALDSELEWVKKMHCL